MSRWICHPIIGDEDTLTPVYVDGKVVSFTRIVPFEIVLVDTDNVQYSLYDAFNDCGWKDGEACNFTKDDVFSLNEKKDLFEIFVNDKMVALFIKQKKIG